MNPYAIIGALIAAIALVLGGVHVGKKLERETWQAERIELLSAHAADLSTEFKRYERMVNFNNEKARKASEAHAKELADQKIANDATVARTKLAGGLRINASACRAKDAGAPAAPGAGRPDGQAAGPGAPPGQADRRLQEEALDETVRLPTEVENDLFDLAEDADKLATQLRNLQKWVRDNGLYGPATK